VDWFDNSSGGIGDRVIASKFKNPKPNIKITHVSLSKPERFNLHSCGFVQIYQPMEEQPVNNSSFFLMLIFGGGARWAS
jgi:hypothetical protein